MPLRGGRGDADDAVLARRAVLAPHVDRRAMQDVALPARPERGHLFIIDVGGCTLSRFLHGWKLWMEDDKAEKQPYPQKWNDKTGLQKLCIVRCMRPDRMTNALEDYVRECRGDRYIVEPP